jgi:hypothetical protein
LPARELGFFMAKTIATIEVMIERKDVKRTSLKAYLTSEGKTSYTISLSKPDGTTEITILNCESQGPATAWTVQRLKQLVDDFAPDTSTINVVEDTLNLLPKVTYRCPNQSCRTKLFESWGSASGIRIVCRKCKHLGTPIPDFGDDQNKMRPLNTMHL